MTQNEENRIGFGKTYFIPLDELQFAQLGKAIAIISTIESVIDELIMVMSGVTDHFILKDLTSGKTTTAKIIMFRQIAETVEHGERLIAVKSLCAKLEKIMILRNHAVHGVWGDLSEGLTGQNEDGRLKITQIGKIVPAALDRKRPDTPLLASNLKLFLEEAEECAKETFECYSLFADTRLLQMPLTQRFVVHSHPRKRAK